MIIHGDCLEKLRELSTDSADALVTDPPAGISFMGKSWDGDKGGRKEWCAWLESVMRECLRVVKPGAHGLVWALPRTSHWTATALEDAGFEIRDCVYHVFGSGFPKSLDVSKAIDKAAGAERINGAPQTRPDGSFRTNTAKSDGSSFATGSNDKLSSLPTTDAAKQWAGFGTALKPAVECWWLVRKPLSEKTIAANVIRWGTGALNIDGGRIEGPVPKTVSGGKRMNGGKFGDQQSDRESYRVEWENTKGRFPSHLVLSHTLFCKQVGTKKVKASAQASGPTRSGKSDSVARGEYSGADNAPHYGDADGTETVEVWECSDDCAVRELDWQSGTLKTHGGGHGEHAGSTMFSGGRVNVRNQPKDSGGASRFFYCAKVSASERNAGLEGMPDRQAMGGGGGIGEYLNNVNSASGKFGSEKAPAKNFHPTVKPQKLMRYLARLITPPGGTVLDPFTGSGSTGVACATEGFQFIGIEREQEYVEIAKGRVAHVGT